MADEAGILVGEAVVRHCHVNAGLVRTDRIAFAYGQALISPPPLSTHRHPASRLALFSLRSELQRRRGYPRRAWHRCILRDGPPLGIINQSISNCTIRRHI